MKILIKSCIIAIASMIMAISIYFNIDFFLWWGFNNLFAILISIIIVILMDGIFQVFIYLLKNKKYAGWSLFPVWLIFFVSSIFCTYVGMNYKTEQAKKIRMNTVIDQEKENPVIDNIRLQIQAESASVSGYQDAYNKESNWWVKDQKIRPLLEESRKRLQDLIQEEKNIIIASGSKMKQTELFLDADGITNPLLKILLPVVFGFLIDIGSCIVLLFSWILDTPGKNINQTVIKTDKQQHPVISHKKSFADYVQIYADTRITSGKFLNGKTSPEVTSANIPYLIFERITKLAIEKDLIEITGKRACLCFGVTKEIFIKELINEL